MADWALFVDYDGTITNLRRSGPRKRGTGALECRPNGVGGCDFAMSLRERGVAFTPFERFSQIQGSLFATPGSGESFPVGRGELG